MVDLFGALRSRLDLIGRWLAAERDWTLETLVQEFDAGRLKLWAVQDRGRVVAFVATRIDKRPKTLVLTITHVIGERIHRWLHLIEMIEEYGREMGCHRNVIDIAIRDANGAAKWARRLSGYTLTHAKFERAL